MRVVMASEFRVTQIQLIIGNESGIPCFTVFLHRLHEAQYGFVRSKASISLLSLMPINLFISLSIGHAHAHGLAFGYDRVPDLDRGTLRHHRIRPHTLCLGLCLHRPLPRRHTF